ncbi:hypothetical protein OAK03_01725 [Gammaproteobacteria bacterium]|jgi:hypothetical protein|nr:hypothetical protein [Gammaproteobacteria bacterium]
MKETVISIMIFLLIFIFIIAFDFYITGNLSKDQFKNIDEIKGTIENQ